VDFAVHAIELLLIAGVFIALGLTVAFLAVRSYVRHHWRIVRAHPVTRGAMAAAAVASAGREHYSARRTPEQVSRGTASRVRRRMWVAVDDAEQAVAHADAVGAPVAELPGVCRSLRSVAGELDSLLRLERRVGSGHQNRALRAQVAELVAASRDVQSAALAAGSDATEPQLRALVRRATDEVEIVSSALGRLRTLAPPR
jgi:hypothetical protein